MNPSAGDVSVFLPTEQALLPGTGAGRAPHGAVRPLQRSSARSSPRSARCAPACPSGSATGSAPRRRRRCAGRSSATPRSASSSCCATGGCRRPSSRRPAARTSRSARRAAIVYRLAALFSLDSFGGGFVITALVVLWLQKRFDLSLAVSGAVFFWAGVLSAFSALVAVRIAGRIGLVRTMVFTHLPANGFLILAAFMPTAPLAIAALLVRSALSQMDVPARTSYVMAVVSPGRAPGGGERHERAAQPGRRRCRRSPPAGCSGTRRSAGRWSSAARIKAIYDLLLLRQFRDVRPPEEASTAPTLPVHLALTKPEAASPRGHRARRSAHRPRRAAPRLRLVPAAEAREVARGGDARGPPVGPRRRARRNLTTHPSQAMRRAVAVSGGPQRPG